MASASDPKDNPGSDPVQSGVLARSTLLQFIQFEYMAIDSGGY